MTTPKNLELDACCVRSFVNCLAPDRTRARSLRGSVWLSRLVLALCVGGAGQRAVGEPVCLVNLGNTLFRVNANGSGGFEQFTIPGLSLVAMTQVPPGVFMMNAGPGDIIAVDPTSPNTLYKIVNAQSGTPGLVQIGTLAADASSIGFANGQLFTIDQGGLVRRFDLQTYTQIGPSIDTTGNIAGIVGFGFDGNQTWYAVSSNNSLYRFPSPVTPNSMTLVGTLGFDLGSAGLEVFAGQVWVATKNGGALVIGTCNTQTGAFSQRWQLATPIGGNVGFVAFQGQGTACDSLDFNNDGIEQDPTDLEAFFSVYSGGPCLPFTQPPSVCNDIDFNNDGLEQDPTDLESFFSVYSGGPCV